MNVKGVSMISRGTIAGVVAAVVAAGAATALATPSREQAKTLKGTVGPAFTIHLTMNGKSFKSLTAGTYTFVISDKAPIHNFTIEQEKGGKFEKDLTSVPFVGTKTVTVKLTAGRWKFYCKSHEAEMFGFFTVK
jgi:plastocyanin